MRIAAIHDLSCFGRCALTVILPVLSVMGHQVVPVPTALLSTHTGGFERERLFFLDLTDEMKRISDHFYELGVCFDAIYSGFLGDERQIEAVESIIDRFSGKGCPVLIDPVMGDDGELYSTYNDELVEGMKRLCHRADIITPNLTEACLLTGVAYRDTSIMEDGELEAYIDSICSAIELAYADTRPQIVITGIHKGEREVVTVLCMPNGERRKLKHRRLMRGYPGTGDIFASVLLGAYLKNKDICCAAEEACEFVARTIEYTMDHPTATREGVALEPLLPLLARVQ